MGDSLVRFHLFNRKCEGFVMGYRQTSEHRQGRGSWHQIGLVRGQFGAMPMEDWLRLVRSFDFDGYEAASWELSLGKKMDDVAVEKMAGEVYAAAKQHDLQIFSVAAHLQGQALGDEPSVKTLQFVGGEAVEAYCAWRQNGNNPPIEDPFFVPVLVADMIRVQAEWSLVNTVKLAHYLGKLQNRIVPVSGFVGSPAGRWNHWFGFPPAPKKIGEWDISDVNAVSGQLLIERFSPVFEACLNYGTTFDLECHPSEFAMGDLASAEEYLKLVDGAGFAKATGFNFDNSHMAWQGVSGIDFIREFHDRIHCVHLKGVQVVDGYTKNGLLGGHKPMGHPDNGWNFVTPGCARDAVNLEELIVEFNRVGYDGAFSIEWEDNDQFDQDGARSALEYFQRADKRPSGKAHDASLKA